MKKLLLLIAFLVGAAHAGTVIVPVPTPVGKICMIKFGDRVMVNLSAITVVRYYDKSVRFAPDKTMLFAGDRDVQTVEGNALAAIEARVKECEK
jgi:hypothetical protein